jgi:hypothetical protein
MRRLTVLAIAAALSAGCLASPPPMRPATQPAVMPQPAQSCAGSLCFPYADESEGAAATNERR